MHNERCYGFISEGKGTAKRRKRSIEKKPKTWKEARDHCGEIAKGYDLVVIQNEEENKFLQNKLTTEFNEYSFWIGLKAIAFKEKYIWVDESNLVFGNEFEKHPWLSNEPNNLPEVIKKIPKQSSPLKRISSLISDKFFEIYSNEELVLDS